MRLLLSGRLGLVSIAALAWLLASCSEKPAAPTNDNPFDPNGNGPDPYELVATVDADSVVLSWIDTASVSRWQVYHSTESANSVTLLPLAITVREGGEATSSHRDYAPGVTNWYRVQAIAEGEIPTSIALGAAAMVSPPPLVRLAGGGSTTPTRQIQLEIRNDLGGQIELSNARDFADTTSRDLVSGEVLTVDWTLPDVTEFPTPLEIYFRPRINGSVGAIDSLSLQANLNGGFAPENGIRLGSMGLVVVDSLVSLRPSGPGATSLRISIDEGDTTAVASVSDPIEIALSTTSSDTVKVRGFFGSDFGIEREVTLNLVPAGPVGRATMVVAENAVTTSSRTIRIVPTADNAGYVRFSEDLDFTGVPFVDWADTLTFELSETPGEKTVYGIFSNPWDPDGQSATLDITLVGTR